MSAKSGMSAIPHDHSPTPAIWSAISGRPLRNSTEEQ